MSYKVLIVEDDPMVSMINERYVSRNDNFTVSSVARNGKEALDYLSCNTVDLVVLDKFMPVIDGVTVLQKIRELNIECEVIMVTAANDTSTIQKTMHLGVIDYLIKPFTCERFDAALKKFINKVETMTKNDILEQKNIDSLMQSPPKEKEKYDLYPKGIQKKTLDMLISYFNKTSGYQRGESIASDTGLSIVTIRHYMSYLVKQNVITETINYETGGRPSSLYCLRK